jgi:Icc-related predicted phosphoesterase
MKVGVVSDLHLEFGDLDLQNDQEIDVLVLGGDICIAADLHDFPASQQLLPDNQNRRQLAAKSYRQFFQRCSERFPHVIYIMGNHEYYHGTWEQTFEILRKEVSVFPNIHLLEMEDIIINDVHFIGSTLWTDCNRHDPLTMLQLYRLIADYRMIRVAGEECMLRTHHTVALFEKTKKYIFDRLNEEKGRCAVVCTHHAPSNRSIHPKYANQTMLNGAFKSDLDDFIMNFSRIALWTHGHVHTPFDYMIGATRVICNPRGYVGHERSANDRYEIALVEV